MRLRSQRKQAAAAPTACADNPVLPPELMYILADRLDGEALAFASQTCQAWAKLLRQGITRATLFVGGEHGPHRPVAALDSLAKHSAVSLLTLVLGARSADSQAKGALARLDSLKSLDSLLLRFMVSPTSRKGGWPLFFFDGLTAARLGSLTVQAPPMPTVVLSGLLEQLSGGGGVRPPAAPQLTHLVLDLGGRQPGSQLPEYSNPSWLVYSWVDYCVGLDAGQLKHLAGIRSLRSLACGLAGEVTGKDVKQLSQLTALTQLELTGGPLKRSVLAQLPPLKSLRVLKFTVKTGPLGSDELSVLQELGHLQQLDLSVVADSVVQMRPAVETLLSHPPAALRGLSLQPVLWSAVNVAALASLTSLTSLELLKVSQVDARTEWDISPLSRLTALKKFTVDGGTLVDLWQVKFAGPPPPPKPERVLTGACQSVGKRQKRADQQQAQQQPSPQDLTLAGDVSGIWAAFPQLQQLRLTNLAPYAVANTAWAGLSRLTCLTSLALSFRPVSSGVPHMMASGCEGVRQPISANGGGMPLLRLEQLPPRLVELQLTHACVFVPATGTVKLSGHLTSLSLAKCHLATTRQQQQQQQSHAGAASSSARAAARAAGIVCEAVASNGQAPPPEHPLLVLLRQHVTRLAQLELADLQWLTDDLLCATAAMPSLRGLASLSVIGVGNQAITHGGLLGLTGLGRLRRLRWHVGDALALMPDMAALGCLKGLVALHLPIWLHAQLDRWGAYAVLDDLPLCDVHVEVPV